MIVARGVAGFGAGGEYPVCATSATEAADETVQLRERRGFWVAITTNLSLDLVRQGKSLYIGDLADGRLGVTRFWSCRVDCPGLL